MKMRDENYMGVGKTGLDDESFSEEANSNSETEKETTNKKPKTYKDYMTKYQEYKREKIPCFSQGYYLNELIPSKKISSDNDIHVTEINSNGCFDENLNKKEEKVLTEKIREILIERQNSFSSIESIIKENREILLKCFIRNNDKKVFLDINIQKMKINVSEKIQKLILEKNNSNNKIINLSKTTNEKFSSSEKSIDNKDSKSHEMLSSVSVGIEDVFSKLSEIDFENLVFRKILKENFYLENFYENQINSIKNILNRKNTLLILPPGKGKSLVYQYCSILLEGVVIFICPLVASISDQLINLPDFISAASLTSFTNNKEKLEIIKGIKTNKIKVLFITPERLAFENINEFGKISLVIFDDVSNCTPLSTSFRASYISIKKLFGDFNQESNMTESNKFNILNELNNNNFNNQVKFSLLLLANNSTLAIEEDIKRFYRIKDENIIKNRLTINKFVRITSSKEDSKSKLKSLLKILKSKKFKKIGPIIIFCNSKKSVDTVKNFLFQNSFKADSYYSTKTELERQKVQTKFSNNEFDILVTLPSFSTVLSKEDIRLKIIYEIPSSIELLYQEIGKLSIDNKEGFIHIFCDDEDFFNLRNVIYQDYLDSTQIMNFIKYFISLITDSKNEKLRNIKIGEKRTYSESLDNTFDNNVSAKINSQTLSNKIEIDDENSLHLEIDNKTLINFDLEEINQMLPKKLSFNFTKIKDNCGIKKMMQIYLLNGIFKSKIEDSKANNNFNENKMDIEDIYSYRKFINAKCIGIGPSEINLRFFKKRPNELGKEEEIMRVILSNSREFSGGVYKFNLLKVSELLNINYVDLLNFLFSLQNNGDIGYEGKEESMFIEIDSLNLNIKKLINLLSDINKKFIDQLIIKVF